jgi:hypothetical protein
MTYPPEWARAEHAIIAGDPKDDDAAYLDEMLDETAGVSPSLAGFAAMEAQSPESSEKVDTGEPSTTTILQGSISGTSTSDPVQLLPRDANRRELFVTIEGSTANAIRIGASKADVQRQMNSTVGHYDKVGTPFYSQYHTGDVWVGFANATGTVTVSYWAVTGPRDAK